MIKKTLGLFTLCLVSALGVYIFKQKIQSPPFEQIHDKNTLKILTPSLKERKIAKIKLANGMQVLLISDPGAEMSATGICWKVGSSQDPKEYPGMAHFCEHLLFMGSKKYPDENKFTSSVKTNGGGYNASTGPATTTYGFTSHHNAFVTILDQFAHFFIDPNFNPSCVQRELHAVEQENARYIENDSRRYLMVFKELCNPKHPFSRFATGNEATLKKIPVEEVKKWHAKHYSAEKASLVIYSPLSIKKLTKIAVKHFSQVPSSHHKQPSTSYQEPITSSQQKGHITYIEPIKDMRTLSLTWELPPKYADITNKSSDIVAHILASEDPNSLASKLKKEQIANGVYAGTYRLDNKVFLSIYIDFIKNDKPLPIDQAINYCFQAIKGLQQTTIPSYIVEEIRRTKLIKYNYQERTNPFNFVLSIAKQLTVEPIATYPLQTILPSSYQPEAYRKILNLLTPSECIFEVVAPNNYVDVVYDKKEKWYSVPYTQKTIAKEQLKIWEKVKKHPEMSIPAPNLYLAQDFTLKHKSKPILSMPTPKLLDNTREGELFYYADDRYEVPEISWEITLRTPLIDGSARQTVLSQIYAEALGKALLYDVEQANLAGLYPSFYQEKFTLGLQLHGYNDKAPLLLSTVLDKITTYIPSKRAFENSKATILINYQNFNKSAPSDQSVYMANKLINNYTPDYQACLTEINQVTYEMFCDFCQQLFKKTYIQALLGGNLTEEEALKVWKIIKTKLCPTPYPKKEHYQTKTLILPEQKGPHMLNKEIPRKGNALYLLLEAGEFSFNDCAKLLVLGKALKEDYFNTLRTQQQIAYLCTSYFFREDNQLMQSFLIESSTHLPEELLARTEIFLEGYVKDFESKLSKEKFETLRQQLIVSCKILPRNLSSMCSQLHTLAFEHKGDFKRTDKIIQALKKITYEEVKAYANQLLSRKNRRRLACLVKGKADEKNFIYKPILPNRLKKLGNYSS